MRLFSDDSGRRAQLLQFASWLEGNGGFATVVKILSWPLPIEIFNGLESVARAKNVSPIR
jgi:hypothetical protein